jgi:hypothetical protein
VHAHSNIRLEMITLVNLASWRSSVKILRVCSNVSQYNGCK